MTGKSMLLSVDIASGIQTTAFQTLQQSLDHHHSHQLQQTSHQPKYHLVISKYI
jgi:hypothetical protein